MTEYKPQQLDKKWQQAWTASNAFEVGIDPSRDKFYALEMFAYRVAKYIGAYAVVLSGLDAVTFTARIGEHSALMRSHICKRLGFLGVKLDEDLNRAERTDERRISRGPVAVWVIPTNEELEIARMTFGELSG